jgi:COP9 signalosome complex subunit 3
MDAVAASIKNSYATICRGLDLDAGPTGSASEGSEAAFKKLHDALNKQGEFLTSQARKHANAVKEAEEAAAAAAAAAAAGEGGEGKGEEAPAPTSPLLEACVTYFELPKFTLARMHILLCEVEGTPVSRRPSHNDLWEMVRNLLMNSDREQLKASPKKLFNLCHAYADTMRLTGSALSAILPLQIASNALRPTKGTLVPMEAEMLQCCIASKCYGEGARWLDEHPPLQVDPQRTGLTPPHFLRVLYYAGHIMAAMKRWQDALLYFKCAITAPATAVSSIVMECYKKALLVGLIADGCRPAMPPYTATLVQRAVVTKCALYIALADAFEDGGLGKLKQCVTMYSVELERQGNMGLAKQVVAALVRTKISRLTHAYMTLSLSDIAQQTGLESAADAEKYILDMVERGDIFASIEHPGGTVHFREDHQTEAHLLSKLMGELDGTMVLARDIRELDARMATKVQGLAKTGGGQAADKRPLGHAGMASVPASMGAWEDADAKMTDQAWGAS